MEALDLQKELKALTEQREQKIKEVGAAEGAIQVIQYLIQREAEKAAEAAKVVDAEVVK